MACEKNFGGVFFDIICQSEQDSGKKNSKILPMRQTKAEIQTCWLCLSWLSMTVPPFF